MADDTFQQLADGKVRILALVAVALARSCRCIIQLDGQKAFLTGKLKTKGNMMFATKLDCVLKVCSLYLLPYIVSQFLSKGRQGEGEVVDHVGSTPVAIYVMV